MFPHLNVLTPWALLGWEGGGALVEDAEEQSRALL